MTVFHLLCDLEAVHLTEFQIMIQLHRILLDKLGDIRRVGVINQFLTDTHLWKLFPLLDENESN